MAASARPPGRVAAAIVVGDHVAVGLHNQMCLPPATSFALTDGGVPVIEDQVAICLHHETVRSAARGAGLPDGVPPVEDEVAVGLEDQGEAGICRQDALVRTEFLSGPERVGAEERCGPDAAP